MEEKSGRKRYELVQASEFTSTRIICSPGKYFFLKLVKEDIYELNSRTIDHITL